MAELTKDNFLPYHQRACKSGKIKTSDRYQKSDVKRHFIKTTEEDSMNREQEEFLRRTPDFCERIYLKADKDKQGQILSEARERAAELDCSDEFEQRFGEKLRTESKLNILTICDPLEFGFNDRGTSELFAKLYSDELRFSTTAKEWVYYNGKYWIKDIGGMNAHRLAKEFFDLLIRYSITIKDEDERQRFYGYYVKFGAKNKRDTLIKDSADNLCISSEDFDRDVNLFNCLNGTLELDTLRFREHRSGDMLTKISNIFFDKKVKSELWEKFISDVLPNDKDKQRFLQKALGYAVTGKADLERFFILYGATTRNGKSTLLSTVGYALGDYTANAAPETLALKKKDSRSASEDLARLAGVRFLNVSEPPQNLALDVALVKSLTGGDTITARRLFENSFEYTPQFSLFINTNFLPRVFDETVFSSNRINVISFERHFSPQEQDITLKQKLKTQENISGIFNWLLDGLRLYRSEGLNPPLSVAIATREYAQNSDKFQQFVDEALEADSGGAITAKEVYNAYRKWCTANGYYAEAKGKFMDMLRKRNLLSPTGTIDGRTVPNVVKGYILAE